MAKKSAEIDQNFEKLTADGQEFAENMAKVLETSQKIWQEYLEGETKEHPPAKQDPFGNIPALAEMVAALWSDPQKLAEKSLEYWQAQGTIWHHAMLKWMGDVEAAETVDLPKLPPDSKRFAYKDWSQNALFEYIKQSYLLASQYVQEAVEDAPLDPKGQKKAAFYTRNFVEAMNPANFAALNPEVMEATLAQKGENLVRGFKMMLEDIERGKGKLLIRQTDMQAFEVGRDMALTEGSVIWQNNVLQLIQYAPLSEQVYAKPLLMIPPWINKYYVLDLNPKKSLMKWLVEQGYTVFLISWVNPDVAQKDETWASYMQAVSDVINVVLAETGQKQVNLASYCIGGTLTGTVLAKMDRDKDKRVASATFFTSLLDFEDGGELQVMVDEQTLDMVDERAEQGYLPAQTMAAAFNMLRSNDLIWSYVVNNYMLGKAPFPFDLLYWNADSTAMPARVHHYYLKNFYIGNRFSKGGLDVDEKILSISDITTPVYHIATLDDHIAPATSVYAGAKDMVNANVRFVLSGSGHIAGIVNPPAAGKYQYWRDGLQDAKSLKDWQAGATEVAGSWWPDWDKWLKRRSGKKVPARKAGVVHPALEPAPGSFVRKRFDQV